MTDSGYTCPVEGCEYGRGEQKSLAAVRAHISGTADSSHEWTSSKKTVLDQADQGDDDESDDADDPEPETETETDTDDDMANSDEYEEQVERAQDDDENDDDDDASHFSSGNGGVAIPSRTVLVGVIVLAVLLFAMSRMNGETEVPADDDAPTASTDTEKESWEVA